MKTYIADRLEYGCEVYVESNGRRYPLGLHLDIRNHSPIGFNWGYRGSGAAQLSLTILADHLGPLRPPEYCPYCESPMDGNICTAKAECGYDFSKEDQWADWRHIRSGPHNATDVELKLKDGSTLVGHWASNLSGEEQPPFEGWFTAYGKYSFREGISHSLEAITGEPLKSKQFPSGFSIARRRLSERVMRPHSGDLLYQIGEPALIHKNWGFITLPRLRPADYAVIPAIVSTQKSKFITMFPESPTKLTASNVQGIMLDCIFRNEDLLKSLIPVDGITGRPWFNRERLEKHREEIRVMLSQLPKPFMSAPGWSFLQSCIDCHGEQWTGYQRTMEDLFVLGMGLGLVKYATPREQWKDNPGAAPYLIVNL